MTKYAFTFNQYKCVGCDACIIACFNENGLQRNGSWRQVVNNSPSQNPYQDFFNLSMACNHCDDAPCMKHCPSYAYYKSPVTGAVLYDPDKCIGCQYCIWNCPYDAPKFNKQKGIVEKCDFCESRLEQNDRTACTSACPTGALDLIQDTIEEKEGFVKLNGKAKPSFYFARQKEKKEAIIAKEEVNESRLSQLSAFTGLGSVSLKKHISPAGEWPLIIFSFLCSLAIPLFIAFPWESSEHKPLITLIILMLAALFSILHLGRKERFWRAILNIRHSWLSREILFFSIAFFYLFIDLLLIDLPDNYFLIPGILLLLSIDMLYPPVLESHKIKIHSGQTLFISLALFLLFSQLWPLVLIVSIFRITLLLFHFKKLNKFSYGITLLISRILLYVVSLSLIYIDAIELSMILFLFGEFVERIIFYQHLEIKRLQEKFKNGSILHF